MIVGVVIFHHQFTMGRDMASALQVAQIINALGTLIIGCVVVWITLEQRRLSNHRLAFDLFEKQYDLLKISSNVWPRVLIAGKVESDDYQQIQDVWIRSRVLFSSGVQDQICTIKDQMKRYLDKNQLLFVEETVDDRKIASREKYDALAKIIHHFPSCINSLVREIQP